MKRYRIKHIIVITIVLPLLAGCSGKGVFFDSAIVLATGIGSWLSNKSFKGSTKWNVFDWMFSVFFVLASLVVVFTLHWFFDVFTYKSWYETTLNSIVINLISVVSIVVIALCIGIGLVCRYLSKNQC